MPEASVIRRRQALSGIIGRKELRRRNDASCYKARGLTTVFGKRWLFLMYWEGVGTGGGAVKCVDIIGNAEGVVRHLAIPWRLGTTAWGAKQIRDLRSPSRKRSLLVIGIYLGDEANALSRAPGEYERKLKTQRNWRGGAQAVERVV